MLDGAMLFVRDLHGMTAFYRDVNPHRVTTVPT
jgi:hypothetical protein